MGTCLSGRSAARSSANLGGPLSSCTCQMPERSTFPSGVRGAGAARLGLPSGVRGMPSTLTVSHCADGDGDKSAIAKQRISALDTRAFIHTTVFSALFAPSWGMLRIIERRHQDSVNRKSKLSTSESCEVCAIRYDTGAVKLITPIVQRWISDGLRDPEGFWERAAEELPWFRRWDRVFEWDFPTFRWFVGAQTNICHTALDRHVSAGRGGHAALAYVNERGERVVLTYAQLLHEVTRLASALRGLGVSKGDRLTIYMP